MSRPVILGAALVLALALAEVAVRARAAVVTTDHGARRLWVLRGQAGAIRFVNSVTGRPVEIDFRIGARFDRFAMRTDAATEEYYTAGLYPVNDVVSRDATAVLRFCSVAGIQLVLGFHHLDVKDGCLEVKLP